eukprot:1148132-Rhodomonas_salina.1
MDMQVLVNSTTSKHSTVADSYISGGGRSPFANTSETWRGKCGWKRLGDGRETCKCGAFCYGPVLWSGVMV